MSFTLHMFWWSQSFFLFFVVVILTVVIDISYYSVNYRLFRPVVCEMVILIPLHSRMDYVTSLNKLT
jgi:hypothetical protein